MPDDKRRDLATHTGSPHAATMILSVLAASIVAAVAAYFIASAQVPVHATAPGSEDVRLKGIADRLDALAQKLDDLERRPTGPAVPDAGRREAVPEFQRAEIERLVRDILAERESAGEEGAAAPLNVDALFAELIDAGSQSARGQELWEAARAAGKIDELVAAFERRAKENPNSPDAQADLGDAYVQKLLGANDVMTQAGLSMQADRAYDEALALDDTHWRARFSKAISYTFWPDFLGKKAESIRHFEILIDQQEVGAPQPGFEQTYLVLGNLYEQQGKADEARAMWERGLALHPDAKALREKLGR